MRNRITHAALLLLGICISILAGIAYYGQRESPAAEPAVYVAGETIRVTVADSPKERERGLSGREALGENEGMFFIFEQPGEHSFWMKDMRFPIDIIWISAGGTIVDMKENVGPDTYPATFTPREAALYVLEVPAGWAKAHGVAIGDQAAF